jgi:hypothetical protein
MKSLDRSNEAGLLGPASRVNDVAAGGNGTPYMPARPPLGKRKKRGRRRQPSTPALERALDQALSVLIEHRTANPIEFRAYSSAELARGPIDPIGERIKDKIRTIAEELVPRLSWDEIHELAERVAGRDPENYGRRLTPLFSVFDGMTTRDGAILIS